MLEVEPSPKLFSDHYEYWRIKRICAIVQHYGEDWFQDKTVLELGAGHGDIGRVIASMGATVVFAEGRGEHCDYLRYKFPKNEVYQVNLENEWPFAEGRKFDLILHLGLLYHLDNFAFSLAKCAETTDNFVLETEVCDSDDASFILKIGECRDNYDQSLIGRGSRPSGPYLENLINNLGFICEAVKDNKCNAHFHIYDWPITNTNNWQHGLRRFWFCKKEKSTFMN
jgi:SAM-dependent methyltransferase